MTRHYRFCDPRVHTYIITKYFKFPWHKRNKKFWEVLGWKGITIFPHTLPTKPATGQ